MNFPFWVWFALAHKIAAGEMFRVNRHGAPRLNFPPFRFDDELYLPLTYWDGGPWALPAQQISADDPGAPRSRLYVWAQNQELAGRKWGFKCSRHWFPKGSSVSWRYKRLRNTFDLSEENARFVISLEDGINLTPEARRQRISRERRSIQEILSSPPGKSTQLTHSEWEILIRMFGGGGKIIRLPRVFPPDFLYTPWPPEIEAFAVRCGLVGKTFNIPKSPPQPVTLLEEKVAI